MVITIFEEVCLMTAYNGTWFIIYISTEIVSELGFSHKMKGVFALVRIVSSLQKVCF